MTETTRAVDKIKARLKELFKGTSLPNLGIAEWAKALLLRAIIPAYLLFSVNWLAGRFGRSLTDPQFVGLIATIVGGYALWMTHWYYAKWCEWFSDHDVTKLVKSICRPIFLLVVAFLVASLCQFGFIGEGGLPVPIPGSGYAEVPSAWAVIFDSHLIEAYLLFAFVSAARFFFQQWVARQEANEKLWWIDQLGNAAFTLARMFSWLGILVGLNLYPLSRPIFSQLPMLPITNAPEFWLDGPWLDEIFCLIRQLSAVGILGLIMLTLAVRIAWRRFRLWREVERSLGRAAGLTTPAGRIEGTALKVAGAVGYTVLTLSLISSLCSLITEGAVAPTDLFGLFLSEIPHYALVAGFGPIVFPLAPIALEALDCIRQTSRPKQLAYALGKFATWAAVIACGVATAGGLCGTLTRGQLGQILTLLFANKAVNFWSMLFGVFMGTVGSVVILGVVILIGLALISGEGSGTVSGGPAAAGGGGAGGGSGAGMATGGSVGSGSFGGSTETVSDRYGRKLVEVQNRGILGTAVTDRYGRKIGEVEGELGGGQRARIGDDTYHVQDSLFGDEKIVKKDGEEVGRIDKDFWGDDRFREK